MGDIAISARNLSKCYRVYDSERARLFDAVWPRHDRRSREIWALKDVSFDVRRGDSLGIIGRNGGGKSTLLEILSGTLTPTAGEVSVSGRVSALLELGSGFNPEFSGRDNVILNGLLLGLSREEILQRFHEIEQFAEIGPAIDRPVRTYSSGMVMRLAFAVQVLCDPDILIVDEALSVGDFFFQQKCFARLRKMREEGLTLLFVSHDLGTVRNLCSTALYLINGRAAFCGDSTIAIKAYLAEKRDADADPSLPAASTETPVEALDEISIARDALWQRSPAKPGESTLDALVAIFVADGTGRPTTTFRIGDRLVIDVRFRVSHGRPRSVAVVLKNRYDQVVTSTGTYSLGIPLPASDGTDDRILRFDIGCAIEAGEYSVKVTMGEIVAPNQGRMIDESGWIGPITIQWDYEKERAPFLGMFGLPITASVHPAGAES